MLVGGFVFLIKGADLMVEGAAAIARGLHVSDVVIGLTIVAFGTSAPELVISVVASFRGTTDLAIANVIGSNICNILLIIGVAALIQPVVSSSETVWREIPFMLHAAILLGILPNDAIIEGSAWSGLGRIDGLVMLGFFIIFMYYLLQQAHQQMVDGRAHGTVVQTTRLGKSALFVVVGIVGLGLGGEGVVRGAVDIAAGFGVSEAFIGLTVVAIGTSLPELATSAVAAIKKNSDIALGNIVGSSIFNVLFVLGICSLIRPVPFSVSLNVDVGLMILATGLLFVTMFTGRAKHSVQRPEGALFLVLYTAYIAYVVVRA